MLRLLLSVLLTVGLTLALDAADPAPGKQVELSFKTSDGAEVGYLCICPEKYDSSVESWPLVMFLHGRGESNGPLSIVAAWGPPQLAARGDKLPYILIAPQCPREDNWRSAVQQKRLGECWMQPSNTTKSTPKD